MKARLPHAPASAEIREPENAFRVVIVYEDYASGRNAMDTYQLLLSRFGRELDFRIRIWPFAMLQGFGADTEAVQDAIDAEAIILATHRRETLPDAIREWINAWAPRKREQPSLLIGLFDCGGEPPTASCPVCDYLKRAAAGAGMDFLARRLRLMQHERRPGPALNQPGARMAPEGWGLND